MTRRALIIQSGYDPLDGFENGAACIAQVLQARGFEIIECRDANATRAGVLRAYDALIAGACKDDAVVIYYIGHGGLLANRDYNPETPDLPRYIQNICPSDYAQTTEDDFRGISSFELSLRLAALTRKTVNVTVILECCYASSLVRGERPTDVVLNAPKLTRIGLSRHLRALRAESADFAELDRAGNPHAVRLSAAGQTEAAYQIRLPAAAKLQALGLALPAEGWVGAMTFRLAEILIGVGATRVSWRSVLSALRTRMAVQRPEIAGPDTRVPFSLATVEPGVFPVHSEGEMAIVDAGRLMEIGIGDVYGVMPAGSATLDAAKLIEELTIDEVSATEARGRRHAWRTGTGELPVGAVAIPISLVVERIAVRVVADVAARRPIDAALRASKLLCAATDLDQDILAELHVNEDELELHDALGPLFAPAHYPDRLDAAIKDLENLATEHRLRALSDQQGIVPWTVTVALVLIRDGHQRVLADHGEALGLADRIALKLVNTGATTVYANAFNIGLRRRIARLSGSPSGIKLTPGETAYVSNELDGMREGFSLHWPAGLPRDQPRLDTMMVVLTPNAADLTMLVSNEHLGVTRRGLTTRTTRGGDRGVVHSTFAIHWRDYRLFPIDASLDFGEPQVDASPPASSVSRVHASSIRRILLEQLTSAPGTRVDVLVCARSATTPMRATTVLGDAPSELAIWLGDLHGLVDVYVWTSSVNGDRRTLAELLDARRREEPVATLRTKDGEPRAKLAAGSSMQLAAMARAALRGIAPGVATAFHATLGADEVHARRYTAASVAFAVVVEPRGS